MFNKKNQENIQDKGSKIKTKIPESSFESSQPDILYIHNKHNLKSNDYFPALLSDVTLNDNKLKKKPVDSKDDEFLIIKLTTNRPIIDEDITPPNFVTIDHKNPIFSDFYKPVRKENYKHKADQYQNNYLSSAAQGYNNHRYEPQNYNGPNRPPVFGYNKNFNQKYKTIYPPVYQNPKIYIIEI